MQPLLQIRNLTIRYGSGSPQPFVAVLDVSFDIAPGETLGIMGESGSGKSSIALAVMNLIPNERGQITGSVVFHGSNLLGLGERKLQKIRGAAISMVYQEPEIALGPVMRVGQQVAEVVRAHRQLSWTRCRTQARDILARVGFTNIDRIFDAYPHQLSGGQRQRIVLAQALVCAPALLIADEPTAHLDLRSQAEFLDLLETIKRESQISILLISHTPEIQARMADRLLVMQAGRIAEQGRFSELARNSQHPYTRAMLGRSASRGGRAECMVEEGVIG